MPRPGLAYRVFELTCFYDLGRDFEVATKIALSSKLVDDERLTRPVYRESYLSALFDQTESLESETTAYVRAVLLPYAREVLARTSRLAPQVAANLAAPTRTGLKVIVRLEPDEHGREFHAGVQIDLDGSEYAYWRDGYWPSPGKIVRIVAFGPPALADLLEDETVVAQLSPDTLAVLLTRLEAEFV